MAGGVELATAYVTILPDGSKIGPEVKKSFAGADGEASKAGQRAGQKFGGSFKGVVAKGAGLFAGIFAADKAIEFFKGAIDGASDLNEAGTKINAIFGKDGAAAVQKFAAGGARALGQTKLDVLDAASNFGTFGKAAGLAGQPLAKFANGFAGLSTDLASFYNTSPEQAVEAIGAALRGEAEPIRQYGVLLDDATLRQEALRLGLIKTTKNALTPQQKVLAAQSAIYKQTKDAQGDFQRTSGGLANQQRILSATFKDTQAQLGTKLLPIVLKGVQGLNKFVTGVQNGTGAGGEFADIAKRIYGDLKPVGSVVAGVAKVFGNLPGPVKSTAIQAGIFALVLPRLTAGLTAIGGRLATAGLAAQSFGLKMSTAETRMAAVSRGAYALGGALRQAGGVGGMLLLSNAATQTNQKLRGLESTAGGALLGFSLGGPIGAAVGAGAGALFALAKNARESGNAFKVSKKDASDYAGTLNEVTGAAGRQTRSLVLAKLAQKGILELGAGAGISSRTLVDAALGKPEAIAKTKNAVQGLNSEAKRLKDNVKTISGDPANPTPGAGKRLAENKKAIDAAKKSSEGLASVYGQQGKAVQEAGRKTRLAYLATADLKTVLKGFPKAAVTEIKANGVDKSRSAVLGLAKQYNLTPKEIVTVAGLAGYDITLKEARGLKKAADAIPKKTPIKASTPGAAGAKKGLDAVTKAAQNAGKQKPKPSVNANTKPFYAGLSEALRRAGRSSATADLKVNTSAFTAGVSAALVGASRRAATVKLPGRMAGGPVNANQAYWVGERGPEIFAPSGNGNIVPNHKIGANNARALSPALQSSGYGGGNFVLMLDDGTPLTGYIQDIADDSVASAQSLVTQGGRS